MLLCLSSFSVSPATGQVTREPETLLLRLEIQRLLSYDFEGYLHQDQLYLPAKQLFSILMLPHNYKEAELLLEVFSPASGQNIIIDFKKNRAKGLPPTIGLSADDYILGRGEVYLRRAWLEKALDVTLLFDFRRLSLQLLSSRQFPVMRDYHRRRLSETIAVKNRIPRAEVLQPANRYSLGDLIAHWSLSSSHSSQLQDYAYRLGIGGQLLGGDLTLKSFGSRQYGFRADQIRGQWKYPIYHSSLIEQLSLGDHSQPDVLSGTYQAYRGIHITNRPKAPRRTFGTYRFTESLPEGWDAELYVNNMLSDIAIGDQQDSLDFRMPIRYGSNSYALHYYDSWGLDFKQRFQIYIPPDFLPRGEMEYTLSAGRYTSMDGQDFVDAALKWGSSDHLTFGGGLRYAPSANGRTAVPFAQAWARLGPRLIVEASHAYAFLSKAALRYTLPTMSPLRLSVTRHHAKSRFNRFGKSLEAALSTYLPVQLSPTINVSTFLSTNYTEYYHGRLLSIYGGVTSSLPADLWLRLSSRVQFRNAGGRPLKQVQHATDVHLSKRLLRRILLKPGIRYNHQLHKVTQSQLEISTRLWRYGDISLSARRSHQLKNTSIFLRLSFNLPYARHSSYVSTTQGQPALHQSTSGTIVMDRKNRFYTDDRSWMGTAAARIDPYLDLNGNGQKEQTEPPVDGLKAHIYEVDGSSFPLYRNRRFVSGLTPYRPYLVEIDASSMDNPLWIPSNTMYRLQVAPHTINNLPVPVWVGGEVAGKVKLEGGNQAQMDRLSGLNIYLLGPEGTPPDTLRTYFNGAFFHVGLKPGRYTARLDSQQLASRLLRPVGKDTEFHIEPTMQGDIVEDVNIRVAPNQPEQSLKDTIYTIQIGAFRSRNNATRVIEQARRTTVLVPKIVYDAEDAMYKCQIGLFRTAASASQHLNLLQNKFSDLYEAAFIIDISLKQGTDQ